MQKFHKQLYYYTALYYKYTYFNIENLKWRKNILKTFISVK